MNKAKISAVFITAMIAFTNIFCVSAHSAGVSIYVSPQGSDQNVGTIENPLASFKGARDKIREIKTQSGLPTGGITVYIRGGEYGVTDTLYLTEEDSGTAQSPVIYKAYENEKPIFTGGYRAPSSLFQNETLSNGNSVKTLDVKAFLTEKLGREAAETDYYPQLNDKYANGHNEYDGKILYSVDKEPAMWLARYPNKKAGLYEENPITNYLKTGEATDGSSITYTDDKISEFANVSDVWVSGLFEQVYWQEDLRIASIDTAQKKLIPQINAGAVKKEREFFVYNVLTELDQKGEYYVSREGKLYLYGGTEFEFLNIPVLSAQYMINCTKASFITFSGLNFENSRKSGIFVKGGESVITDNCSFYNFCESAVVIGDSAENGYTSFRNSKWDQAAWELFYGMTDSEKITAQINYEKDEKRSVSVRGKNHGIKNSTVKNTGLCAVSFSGGNVYRGEESGYFAENCDISFPGCNKKTYEQAIKISNVYGLTVKNNSLSHCPSSAIGGYITKGVIENNDIFDNLSESYDMGVIYLNYISPVLDLTINNNYIHDTPSETEITGSDSIASQRSAIAFDNNYGSGAKITNNVFKNIPRGIWGMGAMTAVNNIFIDCFDPVCYGSYNSFNYWNISAISGGDKDDFFSEANEPLYYDGLYYMKIWPVFESAQNGGDEIRREWQEKYPEVTAWIDIVTNQLNSGRLFYNYHNNLFVNSYGYWWNNAKYIGDVYTARNADLQGKYVSRSDSNVYTTNTNCFKDFENGDFGLTYSAKIKYGINSIDFSQIGIQK